MKNTSLVGVGVLLGLVDQDSAMERFPSKECFPLVGLPSATWISFPFRFQCSGEIQQNLPATELVNEVTLSYDFQLNHLPLRLFLLFLPLIASLDPLLAPLSHAL